MTSATTQSTSTPRLAASSVALASATSEKSTPVTCQPRSASQTAFRPSPQAKSSARPGASPATSSAKRRFGAAVQRSSFCA